MALTKKFTPSMRKKGNAASEAGSDSTVPSVASTDDMDVETETAASSDDGLPYPRVFFCVFFFLFSLFV